MKQMVVSFVCVALLLIAIPCFATPLLLPGYGTVATTYTFYETNDDTPTGTPQEYSSREIGQAVVLGNLWLWETLPADPAARTRDLFVSVNPATGLLWGSDVLDWKDQGNHTVVKFWSDGFNPNVVPERSANAVDVLEPPSGYYQYTAGANVYNIYSEWNQVPIPPSALLLGSGLVGLVGLRRFRKS